MPLELARALARAESYEGGCRLLETALAASERRVLELEGHLTAAEVGAGPAELETSGSLEPRRRPNLLFVALGPGPGTVDVVRERDGSWDLVEVLWHPGMIEADRRGNRRSSADLVIYDPDRTKRKFACFADFWRAEELGKRPYANVAILDDDLEPVDCTWSRIFELFEHTGLDVAQPALTPDSTKAWPVTTQVDGAAWRLTDFVEVMAPIFRGAQLWELLPFFLEERNGWGLEALWSAKYPHLGILDATPVRHVRPVGTAHSLGGLAIDPERRAAAFRKKHGLTMPKGVTLKTIWEDGTAT